MVASSINAGATAATKSADDDAFNTIVNPLQSMTKAAVAANAKEFCADHGLADQTDLFVKGALVARDPDDFDDLTELNEHDKGVLRHERDHKWSAPWMLYFTMGVCAVGAATQGWDQTGKHAG